MTQQNQKQQKQQKSTTTTSSQPLIKSLNQFPTTVALGAAADGIVGPFPPVAFETVPVKPIFLDVAWNYIDYPGRRRELASDTPVAGGTGAGTGTGTGTAAAGAASGAAGNTVQDEDGDDSEQEQEREQEEVEVKKVKKSGWFGFGRS